MRDLPRPLTPDQMFMAGVCDRLDAQNTLLGEIRDRLGQGNDDAPPAPDPDGPVPVELREPDPPAAPPLSEPQRGQPATKATRRRAARPKETP
jgi:hypothetical protein